MGMAMGLTVYPVPRVQKVGGMWRVTWADVNNRVWYREFFGDHQGWRDAIRWATK